MAIPTWDFLGEGREPHLPEVLDEGGRKMAGLGSEILALDSGVSSLLDSLRPFCCFQAMGPFPDSAWKPFLLTVRSCLLPGTQCPPGGPVGTLPRLFFNHVGDKATGTGNSERPRQPVLPLNASPPPPLPRGTSLHTAHLSCRQPQLFGVPNTLLSYFCTSGSCNSIPQQRDAR